MTMYDLGLLGGEVFYEGVLRRSNLYIKGGRVGEVTRARRLSKNYISCDGLLILPGVIDAHVHFREPGMSWKEDWATGSLAAVAGGVTSVIDMPNTNPPTTTVRRLEQKISIARRKSRVNFGFHFGSNGRNWRDIALAKGIASIKLFMGSTTRSMLITDGKKIKTVFRLAKMKGIPTTVHAEDDDVVKYFAERFEKRKDPYVHCLARPPIAEIEAITRAIEIASDVGNRLHIAHVSCADSVKLIKEAKEAGLRITAEATPHHLFLDSNHLKRLGNFAKMNPPLRKGRDRSELMRGIRDGTIDIVASDHAPHTKKEKETDPWHAPSGVPGVETILPLLYNEVSRGRLDLRKAIKVLVLSPSAIFGLKRGGIKRGGKADIVALDPEERWTIKDEDMHSKCGWTPFHGFRITGRVRMTIVNGGVAYRDQSSAGCRR